MTAVPKTSPPDLSPAKQALLLRRLRGDGGRRLATIARRPPGTPAPLSFAQRRMWFLEQLEPGSGAFNIPLALRLRGPLDPRRLGQAWDAVRARHEALRTTFAVDGDEQIQVVAEPEPAGIPLLDLSDLPATRREAEVREVARRDMREPLDLTEGPLWRARLVRLAEDDHVLVLVVHHSISDEHSTRILLSDLATAYAGEEIPEPAVQYADVALWQRERLSPERVARQVAYWRETLAGAPPLLDLPTDHPRPPVQSPAGGMVYRQAPAELSKRLDALATAESATPFMTMLAAYAVLLARYCGQDDLTVGVPVAGRDAPELERVVGCLLNTLVLRLRLDGEPTFRELLRRTRRTVLDAFGHAELPFEQLVEQLRPERSLSHAPLYQAMFNLLGGDDAEEPALPGLVVEHLDGISLETTKSDLSLTVTRRPGGLSVLLLYRRELFEPATAEDLTDRYLALLEAVAEDPDRCWLDLPLGHAAAAAADPTGPAAPAVDVAGGPAAAPTGALEVPGADPAAGPTVVELFQARAAAAPAATALVAGGTSVSYRELNRRANRLAHALRERGVRPGVLVGVAVDRSIEMAVAVLGVLKAGGAYVPLDLSHPPARLATVLERAAPALLLVAGPVDLPDAVPRLDVTAPLETPGDDPAPLHGPDDLAYVVHTSGSTGVPKGVLSRHRGVANYLDFLTRQYALGPADTVLQIAGLGFDASVRDLLGPLTAGATVVLLAPEEAKEPAAMLDLVQRHRVTCLLSVVPTLLRAMVTVGGPPAPWLRLVLCSGERLYHRDVADATALFGPQVRVVNQYGPTECTMTTTFHVAEPGAAPDEPVPAGRPIPGAAVYLLDRRGRPVPPGMPGEVYIGGVGVAGGYLGDPEQTARRFLPDPFAGRPDATMYRTGDRARLRRDGTLIFLGRFDDQVKIRGIRVEPGEVEAALRAEPGVRQAAVAVRAGPGGVSRLVGYVTGEADPVAVRDGLKARLPDHLVPAVVVALDALPLTPNGKVDRRALPDPPATHADREYVAPRTPAEERVAAAFADVLGCERVGAEDHFFDLGGDSFAAVRLTRLLGGGMRVIDLFRYPTVAELAAALERPADTAADKLLVDLTPPGRTGRRVLSVVCVPYAGGSPVSFQPLAAALPAGYALYGVSLPGHELNRPDEERQPLEEVARATAAEILSDVTGPVAIYGHCSGEALAVEIARQLEAAGREVAHVYLAAGFPNTRLPGKLFSKLSLDRFTSDRRFQNFFRTMGGFGDELTPEEIRLIIKNLRHDSRTAEEYFTRTLDDPDHRRLTAPITCIVGDRDPLTRYYNERVHEWEAYSGRVSLVVLERAGHYFLRHRADAVAAVITGEYRAEAATATTPAPDASVRRSFGVFSAVAVTQFASLVGSGMSGFALGVWLFQRTGSTTLLGVVSLCSMLPGLIASPLVGAIVDRVDRRKVMIWADAALMCSSVTLAALLWTDSLRPWHLFALSSWFSVCNSFVRLAYTAAVPQLIPKRYLGRANGLAQSGPAMSQVFAPLLAGGLVASIGLRWVVVIDLCMFAVATLTLIALPFPNRLPWRRLEPVMVEIVGGWRYLLSRRGLVALLTHAAVCNLLFAMAAVLVTPLVLRNIDSAGALGTVMAAGGAGAAVGGLVMALWGGPARLMAGFLGFAALGALGIAVAGAGTTTTVMAAGMFGYWLAMGVSNACYMVLIQIKVPHHLHGRIFAMNQLIAFSAMPVGFVLAGPLADRVMEPWLAADGALADSLGQVLGTGPGRGVALLMILVGLLAALVNAGGFLRPRLRYLEREMPDAQPDEALARGEGVLGRTDEPRAAGVAA